MPDSKPGEPVADFAERLRVAMEHASKSPTRTGRESGLPQGYMSRLLGTSEKAKQIFSPGPEVIRKLADYLRVSYEWLAIGRGPMRIEGSSGSPLEDATRLAQLWGTRGDAIIAVAARFRDVNASMSALEWLVAFDGEARRLTREGIPPPEVAAAAMKKKRRAVRTLARRQVELDAKYAEIERSLRETTTRAPKPSPKAKKKRQTR